MDRWIKLQNMRLDHVREAAELISRGNIAKNKEKTYPVYFTKDELYLIREYVKSEIDCDKAFEGYFDAQDDDYYDGRCDELYSKTVAKGVVKKTAEVLNMINEVKE